MAYKVGVLFFYLSLIITLGACNLPPQRNAGAPDLVATITAQALLLQSPFPETVADTPLPQFTSTITPTATPSVLTVTVSQNTNCRSGPGKDYDVVDELLIGETAEVVGKNTANNYWIIKRPSGSGTCWLWGQYSAVSGDTSALTELVPLSTTAPSPTATAQEQGDVEIGLAAPQNLVANKICIPVAGPKFRYNGVIIWGDVNDYEDGYHIYLNGGLFGTVAENATSFPLPGLVLAPGTPIKMGVEAFNDAGTSTKKEIIITCP